MIGMIITKDSIETPRSLGNTKKKGAFLYENIEAAYGE